MDERGSTDIMEQIQNVGQEQELETLKRRLSVCAREKKDLHEELTEVYKIKCQLADLYNTEVLKNKEAEKQVKFFQNCIASAFAERDCALMELEKVKDSDEVISKKFRNLENRIQELELSCSNERKHNDALQSELKEFKAQNEDFKMVVIKFSEVRERDAGFSLYNTLQEKCLCLLEDSSDKWTFSDDSKTSTTMYIASLEEEADALRNSLDKLQSNFRMGLEIEEHLKRQVKYLEKKQIAWEDALRREMARLHAFVLQQRSDVMEILESGSNQFNSVLVEITYKISEFCKEHESIIDNTQRRKVSDDTDCRDVHITGDVASSTPMQRSDLSITGNSDKIPDASDALSQALQEKVAALLLLSQQEEMYFLERDMKNALREKMEELQRNLAQVTDEKVKALLELAQLKRDYQQVQEHAEARINVMKHDSADVSEKPVRIHEHDGRFKNFLKKSSLPSLRWWIGKDISEHEYDIRGGTSESNLTYKSNNSLDIARLRVENALLQESMGNVERLTSSVHKLHSSLIKLRDSVATISMDDILKALGCIITEANQVKTAIGGPLPISWSANAADALSMYDVLHDPTDPSEASTSQKADPFFTSAAFEMVELLILAAQLFKENLISKTTVSQSSS